MADLFLTHGVPAHLRSDHGPEFTAALQAQTLFIEPGSPWENGYVESFNGKLRDALLNRATFSTLTEAKSLIERVATRGQHGAAAPCAGLSAAGSGGHQPSTAERSDDDESSSLIRTGLTLGGRSGAPNRKRS